MPELYRRQGASLASKLVPAANRHLDQRICDVCDRVSRRFRAALIEGDLAGAKALHLRTGLVNLRTPFPGDPDRECPL